MAADGKLVKQIYEPEDDDARQKAENGDVLYAPSSLGNRFVGQGRLAAASDGNIYVLRAASPALIYVISPRGEVVRKLHVNARGVSSDARSIESYAGRLALGFEGTPTVVEMTDLEGNELVNYIVDDQAHLDLACYSSQGLSFIATKRGERSYLVEAKTQ